VAGGKRDEAVRYFLNAAVGIPDEYLGDMDQTPGWDTMLGIAHTIAFDGSFVIDVMQGKPLPADRWANMTVPTLVIEGSDSVTFFHTGADALADVLKNASRRTLEGQTHEVDPEVLAPVIIDFLKS
jgi:pimeloyl-ACP methyl ester carboxylesterase